MNTPTILAPIDAPVNVIATLNGKPFLARFIPIQSHRPLPQGHGESGRAAPNVRPDRVSL